MIKIQAQEWLAISVPNFVTCHVDQLVWSSLRPALHLRQRGYANNMVL